MTADTPAPAPLWTLVLPCAGPIDLAAPRRPNWLLTAPSGALMVQQAAASVPADHVGDIVIAFLREVEDRYHCTEAIKRAFDGRARCIVLEERTGGPADTVRQVIDRAGIAGPMCIKDGDSFFHVGALPDSAFLAVADIRQRKRLSFPGRKSYVRLNEQGMVSDVVEKSIVSHLVSCGLYGFLDPKDFTDAFDRLARQVGHRRLFVSHVLASAILNGRICLPVAASGYVDLDTSEELAEYRANFSSVVLDIDGVIFKNQSKFFAPFWGDPVEPIQENIDHLILLQNRGAQLIFMTARPEKYRQVTQDALEKAGLRPHALIMDCLHGTRYLVNDHAPSNPYPSAVAISVDRNRPSLPQYLLSAQAASATES